MLKKAQQSEEATIKLKIEGGPNQTDFPIDQEPGENNVPISDNPITELNTPPYTVFNLSDKYLCLYLGAFCSFWSSISVPIYYPALTIIEDYFDISEELINLSVVVFFIAQAISPTIFSSFADNYGRRPVLMIGLIGFIGANIGLALAPNYGVILGLRVVQSTFVSPSVAIQSGLVGDYTQRFERGGFIGLSSGLTLMGLGAGAIIGAGLTSSFGWRSIFWFLVIGGSGSLITVFFLLPETNRAIVGNQSIIPYSIFNKAPVLLFPYYRKRWHLNNSDISTLSEKKKPDYLAPFKIMAKPEIAFCLFCQAMHFVLWQITSTTLTNQLSKTYHYEVMKIGLCYLGGGIGGFIGSAIAGRIMNWNYKRCHNLFLQQKADGIISQDAVFNIVVTRIQVALPFLILAQATGLVFGWCIDRKTNISAVILGITLVAVGCMAMFGVTTTLLVDLFPSNSSAATSSINFARCMSAAIFIAVLTKMNNAMTVGGTFTFIVSICFLSTIGLYAPLKYGMQWKMDREKKELDGKLE